MKEKEFISKKKFIIILGILLLGEIIALAIGYPTSLDVQGWYPLILAIMTCSFIIYSSIIVLIDRKNPLPLHYTIKHTLLLEIVLLIYTILYYYLPVDWLAVNEGQKSLTLIQAVVTSDITQFVIMAVFAIVYAVIVARKK